MLTFTRCDLVQSTHWFVTRFLVSFWVRFWCNLTGGGDGLAFVMQNIGTSLLPQGTGGNLGYNGISPLVIEFDTFEGSALVTLHDHVMNQNGDID